MRKPTDPPLVDTKDEMQPELQEEASATKEPTDPERLSASTFRWVGMHAGIRVIPCLSAR